ncbi:hypothetical protein BJX63DRAFT_229333 [Aspergillus granulosus]|uniref:DUF7730 domain-containing protein n=1 Tax=Aspergillus granulosus TaxID=176169 RepID=A0ABR4HCP5_9EURO
MLPPQRASPLLRLPPELRLQIYSYLLDIQTPYTPLLTTNNHNSHHIPPLIIINDTGNKFTTRPLYRSLRISPTWVGLNDISSPIEAQNKQARAGLRGPLSLLAVNHQIHDEVEDYLYSAHTFFFLNSFDLDSLGPFLDTLSATARARIRYIGFEVYLFVHNGASSSTPKRTFRQYERAARVLEQKLPSLVRVVFYLDPWFSVCIGDSMVGPWCDERGALGRGVGFLGRAFGTRPGATEDGVRRRMEMDFLPEGIIA